MNSLKTTINMLRSLSQASTMKVNRNFTDFLATRIVQATSEATLLATIERLSGLLQSDPGEIWQPTLAEFIRISSQGSAHSVLFWLREYPRIAAMLCMLKKEEYIKTIEEIELPEISESGTALPAGENEINLKITCLSPLAHGSDTKAGNATIFRRMQILSTTGDVLSLPFYAGNALRGQLRDLLADNLLRSIGLIPNKSNPPIKLWFFHALYAGGALESDSASTKAVQAALGNNGAVKAQGVYEFREMLPGLSLLGCAMGNRILSGRSQFADLRPACKQWANGDIEVSQLFEWIYLTRRENHEGHADGDNSSMIANTETLRAGTVLYGGIDIDGHAFELERSALGLGLELLMDRGYLGAENRRGLGQIKIEITNCPNSELYRNFLIERKESILKYLQKIGAANAYGKFNSTDDSN